MEDDLPLVHPCRSPRRCYSEIQGRCGGSRGFKGPQIPGLRIPVGNLRGPCQGVSPTSWKMQQSSGKQQETAQGIALGGLISRDFCPSCCQRWEITHRGQGMMWQRDQVSFGKVIFQFKYHSVTEIFWNPTRLRVRLNYPELLPAIGLGVRRGQMDSDLVHNLLSSRGCLHLWASVSSSVEQGVYILMLSKAPPARKSGLSGLSSCTAAHLSPPLCCPQSEACGKSLPFPT